MKVPRPVIKVFMSVTVMVVLFITAGLAYTWYQGTSGPAVAAPVAVDSQASIKPNTPFQPSKPVAGSAVGAAVELLTSPVAPGANVGLTVRTTPTAQCAISVVYGNLASKDSGLVPKAADAYGFVRWSWTVDDAAPLGSWPVKVTCAFGGRSAVVQGDLQIVQKAP